jgi:hypothetical protein
MAFELTTAAPSRKFPLSCLVILIFCINNCSQTADNSRKKGVIFKAQCNIPANQYIMLYFTIEIKEITFIRHNVTFV